MDGPHGPISGCMVGTQLHDNASYSDKIFCPGYGEFFTQKDLDLEALALALPIDRLPQSLPIELLTIRFGAENIYNAASNDNWQSVQNELSQIKNAWNTYQNSGEKVSPRFAIQMDRAIRNLEGDILEPGILSRHKIGTLNGAVDVNFAILDLEMRYRSSDEIEVDRLAVWVRKTLIDAAALEQGFVLSDVSALHLLQERLISTLPKDKARKLTVSIRKLRTATYAEDFETVTKISKQLLSFFGKPVNQNMK